MLLLGQARNLTPVPGSVSKRSPGCIGEDISQNTQQRGDRTCRDHIQWIGMAPSCGIWPPTHLNNISQELLLSKGIAETKSGAEIEEKTIQRLPHLGIHPICADTKPRHYC